MKYTDLPWYRDALAAKSKPEEEEGILGFLGNNLAAGTGQLISDLGGLHERYARHGRDAEEWHNAPENWGRDWQDYGQEMYERNARDYEPGTASYYLAQALQSTPSTIALGLAGWGAGAAAGSVVPGVGNLVGGAVGGIGRMAPEIANIVKLLGQAGKAYLKGNTVGASAARAFTDPRRVTAALTSGRFEGELEGQGAYDQALAMGYSVEEAERIANEVARDTTGIVAAFNMVPYGSIFKPKSSLLGVTRPTKGLLPKVGTFGKVVGAEGSEEFLQSLDQQYRLGQDIDWQQAADSFIVGSMMGSGHHAAISAANAIANRGKPSEQELWDEAVRINNQLKAAEYSRNKYENLHGEEIARQSLTDAQREYDARLRDWARDKTGNVMSDEVYNLIVQSAQRHGVPVEHALAQAFAESNGNQDVVSGAGAIGVMQLMPETAAGLGVDPHNLEQNIDAGVRYLKQLYEKTGDWTLAHAVYNAGLDAVQRAGGVPNYSETQDYVAKINGYLSDAGVFQDEQSQRRALFGVENYNMPTQSSSIDNQVANLKDGWQTVIPQIGGVLKEKFGINAEISSAARTEAHNAEVGGAKNSYHIIRDGGGDALDIVFDRETSQEEQNAIAEYFRNTGLFSEILYHDVGSGAHLHLGGLKTENIGVQSRADQLYSQRLNEGWQREQKENQREKTPEAEKPLFDINAQDPTTQKLIEQFVYGQIVQADAAKDTDTVNFFTDMFGSGGVFQNTKENLAAIQERYGDKFTNFIQGNQSSTPQEQQTTTPVTPVPAPTQADNAPLRNPVLVAGQNYLAQLLASNEQSQKVTAVKLQEAINQNNTAEIENILKQNNVTIPELSSTQQTQQTTPQQDPVTQNTSPENILPQPQGQPASKSTTPNKKTAKQIQIASNPVKTGEKGKSSRKKQGKAIISLAAQNGIEIPNPEIIGLKEGSTKAVQKWRDELIKRGIFDTKPATVEEQNQPPPQQQEPQPQPQATLQERARQIWAEAEKRRKEAAIAQGNQIQQRYEGFRTLFEEGEKTQEIEQQLQETQQRISANNQQQDLEQREKAQEQERQTQAQEKKEQEQKQAKIFEDALTKFRRAQYWLLDNGKEQVARALEDAIQARSLYRANVIIEKNGVPKNVLEGTESAPQQETQQTINEREQAQKTYDTIVGKIRQEQNRQLDAGNTKTAQAIEDALQNNQFGKFKNLLTQDEIEEFRNAYNTITGANVAGVKNVQAEATAQQAYDDAKKILNAKKAESAQQSQQATEQAQLGLAQSQAESVKEQSRAVDVGTIENEIIDNEIDDKINTEIATEDERASLTDNNILDIANNAKKTLAKIIDPKKYPYLTNKLHSIIDDRVAAVDTTATTQDSMNNFQQYIASFVNGMAEATAEDYARGDAAAREEELVKRQERANNPEVISAATEVGRRIAYDTLGLVEPTKDYGAGLRKSAHSMAENWIHDNPDSKKQHANIRAVLNRMDEGKATHGQVISYIANLRAADEKKSSGASTQEDRQEDTEKEIEALKEKENPKEQPKEQAKGAKASLHGSGNIDITNFVDDNELTPQQQLLQSFGKKLGVRTVFFRNENADFHGAYAGNISYLNVNSKEPLGKVFWHESMHWLKANNSELYKSLVKAAGITDAQRKAYLKETERKDLKTDEEIDEEILADMFDDVAKRNGLMQSIAGKNRGLIERVVQWLKDTMNKFIDHFRNPSGKLTTKQAQALADEFGKTAESWIDENGQKIFRYNRRTHNIELADGREFNTEPLSEEALKAKVAEAEHAKTIKYSFAGENALIAPLESLDQAKQMVVALPANDNSSESLFQKARNRFSSWWNGKPDKNRNAEITDLLHRITGYKVDFGNVKDGDQTIIDDIHKFIRTKHAYEWEKLLPQIGGKIAKTLKLNPTQEMSNYIADWVITGAPNNTSAEAKAFEKAMKDDPFTQSLMLKLRETFQDYHDMSAQDKIGSTLVSRLKGKSWREVRKILWRDKEEEFTDDLHPILRQFNEMIAKAEKTNLELAKLLKENIDVYKKMRLLRGAGGLGKLMVEGDAQNIDKIRSTLQELYPRLNFDKLVSLNMIVDMAGGAEHFEGLMKYAVAKLDKEIHEKARANPDGDFRPQFSESVDDEVIQKGEKQYADAHRALVTYSHILATISWDAGLITDGQYSKMIKGWKNYIPMQRVFDENDLHNDDFKFADSLKPKTGSKRNTYDIWESLTQNTYETFSRAERNRAKQQLAFYARIGEFGDIIQEVETSNPGLDVIRYRENGKMKYLKVFDPAVARAVGNIYHPADTSWIMKALKATSSFMRARYTTGNLGFALGNIPRDMQDAYVHARHVDGNPFVALLEMFRTVKNNFSPTRMWKEKNLVAQDDDWVEFHALGGSQSSFVSEDINQLQRSMDKLQRKTWWDIIKERKIFGAIEAIQAISEQTEYFTRLNTYKRTKAELAKQRGGNATLTDKQLAALDARDASTDFAKAGSSVRLVNKAVLFANAQVQDLAKWGVVGRDLVKGGEARKDAMRKIFRTILFTGVASLAQAAGLALSGDDWDKKYRKLNDWEKETYWYIGGVGDTGFRIPKGQDISTRMLSALMDETADKWLHDDPVSTKRLFKILKDALPSIVPTLLEPYLEARDNYSSFRDAPIVPTGELTRVEWEQYGKETSSFAKWFGSKVGNTFMNEYFISASPRKIDHMIQGYLGTFGSTLFRIPDTFTRGWRLNNYPFISRFVFDASRNSKVVKEYYEVFNKQAALRRAYETDRKYNRNAEKPDGYDPKLYKNLESVSQRLRKLSKLELEALKNPNIDWDTKNERLRKLEKEREQLCEKAMERSR